MYDIFMIISLRAFYTVKHHWKILITIDYLNRRNQNVINEQAKRAKNISVFPDGLIGDAFAGVSCPQSPFLSAFRHQKGQSDPKLFQCSNPPGWNQKNYARFCENSGDSY